MAAPTKVIIWAPEEAEERVISALEIMERLEVDDIHWDTVFASLMAMLSAAHLQVEQQIPIDLSALRRGIK